MVVLQLGKVELEGYDDAEDEDMRADWATFAFNQGTPAFDELEEGDTIAVLVRSRSDDEWEQANRCWLTLAVSESNDVAGQCVICNADGSLLDDSSLRIFSGVIEFLLVREVWGELWTLGCFEPPPSPTGSRHSHDSEECHEHGCNEGSRIKLLFEDDANTKSWYGGIVGPTLDNHNILIGFDDGDLGEYEAADLLQKRRSNTLELDGPSELGLTDDISTQYPAAGFTFVKRGPGSERVVGVLRGKTAYQIGGEDVFKAHHISPDRITVTERTRSRHSATGADPKDRIGLHTACEGEIFTPVEKGIEKQQFEVMLFGFLYRHAAASQGRKGYVMFDWVDESFSLMHTPRWRRVSGGGAGGVKCDDPAFKPKMASDATRARALECWAESEKMKDVASVASKMKSFELPARLKKLRIVKKEPKQTDIKSKKKTPQKVVPPQADVDRSSEREEAELKAEREAEQAEQLLHEARLEVARQRRADAERLRQSLLTTITDFKAGASDGGAGSLLAGSQSVDQQSYRANQGEKSPDRTTLVVRRSDARDRDPETPEAELHLQMQIRGLEGEQRAYSQTSCDDPSLLAKRARNESELNRLQFRLGRMQRMRGR